MVLGVQWRPFGGLLRALEPFLNLLVTIWAYPEPFLDLLATIWAYPCGKVPPTRVLPLFGAFWTLFGPLRVVRFPLFDF